MKIRDLLNAQPVLQKLNDQKMPAKLAYAMAKNFRLVNQELEDYEKARIKILSDNWKIDEKENRYIIPDEDQSKFQKMLNELVDNEVKFSPITIDFELMSGMELAPGEVIAIDWMIKE